MGGEDVQELPRVVRTPVGSPGARGTHGVTDVRRLVEGALHTAFPHRVWVVGRVRTTLPERQVGLHFTLESSAPDEEPFELPCLLAADVEAQVAEVLDRVHDVDVADVLTEGRVARVGGLLRYDAARSGVLMHVSDLDPLPTARGLQDQRDTARAMVLGQGLAQRQQARGCRTAPLVVGLVGAEDDPAVAAAHQLLLDSPYAIELRHDAVLLQGARAPGDIAAGLRESALRSDVVLLVRAVGRPLTLAAFDAREVSQAVAQSPVPVVCGLGGQGEATATDDVAHASVPGGEAAARWVLARLDDAHGALLGLAAQVQQQADATHDRLRAALAGARDSVDDTAGQAASRAAVARRRLQLRLLAVVAVLAVLVAVAAVVTARPVLLVGLPVLAAAVIGAWLWSQWSMKRGSRPMSVQDDEFTTVLTRLEEVREQLASTSSPETVHRLRGVAAALVAQGERILGVTPEVSPGAAGG